MFSPLSSAVNTPWRGSLLPLGCAAAPRFCGRCATEREQAPSPQWISPEHGCRLIHRYREQARSHRMDCPHTNLTFGVSPGELGLAQVYIHWRSSVGASLLAMAAAHSTLIQADPPLSRASSLPQGGVAVSQEIGAQKKHPEGCFFHSGWITGLVRSGRGSVGLPCSPGSGCPGRGPCGLCLLCRRACSERRSLPPCR